MSLVVLSNDASESIVSGREGSIFKPFSFRNSLTSTMEIPVNGQIALHSAKIVLDGSLQVGPHNAVFYMMLGDIIDPDVGDLQAQPNSMLGNTGCPIRFQLFENSKQVQSITPEELADELQRVLNGEQQRQTDGLGSGGLFHPNWNTHARVEITKDAAGAFKGYQVDMKYFASATEICSGTLANATALAGEMVDATSFLRRSALGPPKQLAATQAIALALQPYTITATGGAGTGRVNLTPSEFRNKTMGTIGTNSVSTFGGVVEYDISQCVTDGAVNKSCRWLCGLSRFSNTSRADARGSPGPPNFKFQAGQNAVRNTGVNTAGNPIANYNWIRNYFDYGVVCDEVGNLRVVHTITGDPLVAIGPNGGTIQNNSPKIQAVDYTAHHGGAPFNALYQIGGAGGNASRFERVRFTISGELVKIDMITGAGAVTNLIDFDAAQVRIAENLKPVVQSCWQMSPIMLINNELQQPGGPLDIQYVVQGDPTSGASGFTFATNVLSIRSMTAPHGTADVNLRTIGEFPSWYMKVLQEAGGMSGLLERVEQAWLRIDLATRPYKGLNTAGAGTYDGMRPFFIGKESGVYTPTQGANSQQSLGFNGFPSAVFTIPPWVADNPAGAPTNLTTQRLASGVIPEAASTKSLFIRVDNLTQQSTNAANGNISRIIAHLPISDNLTDAGRLHYEPNTPVYLDLNNTAPLKLNFLDLSIVYTDESVCRSLVGSSVIVLHIKQKGEK